MHAHPQSTSKQLESQIKRCFLPTQLKLIKLETETKDQTIKSIDIVN